MRTPDELLRDFQDENIRLIRENLRLRNQRAKLKRAFAEYVRRMEANFKVGVLDYRGRQVIQIPVYEMTSGMARTY